MTRGINDEQATVDGREDDAGFVVAFATHLLRTTQLAMLVELLRPAHDFLPAEVWIPKSMIHADSDLTDDVKQQGIRGKLVVKTWFARQEGWIDGEHSPLKKAPRPPDQRTSEFTDAERAEIRALKEAGTTVTVAMAKVRAKRK